jgi:hypothetical protein
MKRYFGILVVTAAAIAGPQVHAHHSFAATYLVDQTVTIEGELVQFLFRNPHSLVHLNVKEKDGREVRYSIEWSAADRLEDQGVTRETLKIGDHVIITGSPGRNSKDRRVRMVSLRRPKDGFNYSGRLGESFN